MSHKRYDFQPLGKPVKTDEGFLKIPVFATRSGVFNYIKSDGTIIREFRPEDEVFKKDSMTSLSGMPFTNRHPVVMVDSTNAKEFMVGFTDTEVKKNGNMVETGVTVTDQSTIDEIENAGLREVSCGYSCDLEFINGKTPDGEHFDAIQRNIKYNHLAIVDRGRAGSEVRLRMDSDAAILDDLDNNKPSIIDNTKSTSKGEIMVKITLDGMEFEVESGLAQAINSSLKSNKAQGKTDAMGEVKATLEKAKTDSTEVEKLTAKVDTLEAENKELKEKKMDATEINKLVTKRAGLIETASLVLDSEEIKEDMSDLDIKKAVIAKKCPDLKMDEKSEIYIEARFDHIAETLEAAKADGNEELKDALSQKAGKKDGDDEVDAESIRKNNMKTDSEAYLKPIGFHLN